MASSSPLLLTLLLCLLLPLSIYADSVGQYCNNNYTNTQTSANINYVLADLVEKASIGGFAISSYGSGNDTVYGLAQCRGDVGTNDCSTCLADAARKLPTACPNQADGRIWYDHCFMRYDTDFFIGQTDTGFAIVLTNVENATQPEAFDKEVGELMSTVRARAVLPGSDGLGTGEMESMVANVTVYGLGQCTRDLQPLSCSQCLALAVQGLSDYCRYRKGCQVLYSSCMARYEIYPFFFPLPS